MDKTKQEIKKWISENIIVDRFPEQKELRPKGKHSQCTVVINVSDEIYLGSSEDLMKHGKIGLYFPMGEDGECMGMNSIFGALQCIHSIYTHNPEWKILLHCQAGKNRSPTVRSAFYYMMIGEHEPNQFDEKGILLRNNRLLDNCKRGHLPLLEKTEQFLSNCKIAFDNPHKFFGGMFDWVMRKSELSKHI